MGILCSVYEKTTDCGLHIRIHTFVYEKTTDCGLFIMMHTFVYEKDRDCGLLIRMHTFGYEKVTNCGLLMRRLNWFVDQKAMRSKGFRPCNISSLFQNCVDRSLYT